jgi:hypothetical protein
MPSPNQIAIYIHGTIRQAARQEDQRLMMIGGALEGVA